MALSRCLELHAQPKGYKNNYVTNKKPVGYPETSSICGRDDCFNPGSIWLTEDENRLFQKGERIFSLPSAGSKVRVI